MTVIRTLGKNTLGDKKGGYYVLKITTQSKNAKNGLKNSNLNYLKMDKKKIIYEIIKIVCTAIISITAVLTAQSCTMSLSVSKNNSNSTQKTEQTTTSSVDSTQININPKDYQRQKDHQHLDISA